MFELSPTVPPDGNPAIIIVLHEEGVHPRFPRIEDKDVLGWAEGMHMLYTVVPESHAPSDIHSA
jgi:hypothetical protein